MESDTYFDDLVNRCRESVGCEFVSLHVLDEKTQSLTLLAAVGYPQELIGAAQYKVGEGLTGWITLAGELLISESHQQLAPIPHANSKYDTVPHSSTKVQSLIAVPLLGKEGKAIGILRAENKQRVDNKFSEADAETLKWFAATAALALRLRQESQELRNHIYVFVLMPFDTSFDDIYNYGIKRPIEELGMTCERVDEIQYNGGVLAKFFECVERARFIVADMTSRNANVFYEVGYCHAIKKDVILCTQTDTDIPFDLRGYNHIVYAGKITILEQALRKRILSLIDNEEE